MPAADAFFHACATGDLAAVQALVTKSPGLVDVALLRRDVTAARLLLEAGARTSDAEPTADGRVPLTSWADSIQGR